MPSNTSLVLNWPKQVIQCQGSHIKNGGEGGIQTHETLARPPDFKTGAFDYSEYFINFIKPYITRLND